ncbi:MAG: hypothetical protein SFZ24_11260 [Planctomycetota bacterium]|nr:hypothetical protein [Planctomycetota bacterium]
MYLFVLYAMLIWLVVHAFRRRWPAFLVLALSVPVAFGAVEAVNIYFDKRNSMLWFIASSYELLILGVGLVIALQPRHRRRGLPCRRCRYDVTGNTTGLCPECGLIINPYTPVPPRPRVLRTPAPSRVPTRG